MNRITFFALATLLLSSEPLWSQVQKRVLAEHFTNTRCSICASKNPSLRSNLENHPGVLYVSYYPSAPYSDCEIHQLNPSDNDMRTNFYGVYGGTPRLVINGEATPASVNFGDANLFTPYENDSTAFRLEIEQEYYGNTTEALRISIKIQKLGPSTLEHGRVFAAIIQGNYDYEAPNGETQHRDVFRESIFNPIFEDVNLPTQMGGYYELNEVIDIDESWPIGDIYVLAVLHEEDNTRILQAATSKGQPILSAPHQAKEGISIYPNPAHDDLNVSKPIQSAVATDLLGNSIRLDHHSGIVDLRQLPAGLYVIRVTDLRGNSTSKRIVVQ